MIRDKTQKEIKKVIREKRKEIAKAKKGERDGRILGSCLVDNFASLAPDTSLAEIFRKALLDNIM